MTVIMKTIFEKIIAREVPAEIEYEDDACIAFYDIHPQAPIHLLIVPKKVIHRLDQMEASDAENIGYLLYIAKLLAHRLGLADGFRVVINNGRDAGETVPHLHVHLLGGRPMMWPPG